MRNKIVSDMWSATQVAILMASDITLLSNYLNQFSNISKKAKKYQKNHQNNWIKDRKKTGNQEDYGDQ